MEKMTEKIPLDRVGALIGAQGAVRAELEEETQTKILVDSKTGDVTITPAKKDGGDYGVYRASLVVQAIGHGFNPEKAFMLLEEGQFLTVVDLKDYVRKSDDLKRVLSRLIGTEGKTRAEIERQSKAKVSIYENSVAIIGDTQATELAEKAVEMILQGAPQSTVYSYLEKESKREEVEQARARI